MLEQARKSTGMYELQYTPPEVSTTRTVASLLRAAMEVVSSGKGDANCKLEEALSVIERRPFRYDAPETPLMRGGLAPWQARRVAEHIRGNIGARLTSTGLATYVHLSASHFSRAFKVSFRETPRHYIMRHRVRLAKNIMLSTEQPLSEIALRCGLCDQAHLTRLFQRFVGHAPRSWRRMQGDGLRC